MPPGFVNVQRLKRSLYRLNIGIMPTAGLEQTPGYLSHDSWVLDRNTRWVDQLECLCLWRRGTAVICQVVWFALLYAKHRFRILFCITHFYPYPKWCTSKELLSLVQSGGILDNSQKSRDLKCVFSPKAGKRNC